MSGYDVTVTRDGRPVMVWHGTAPSPAHAVVHAKAAFQLAMRAAALGAGHDLPGPFECEAAVTQSHQGALTEHWTLTSWDGSAGKGDPASLPDLARAAVGVAATAPDFALHFGYGRAISAAVDLVARKDGRIVVKTDLSALADDGLAYLARRREGMRSILLALGVAHLAAGTAPVSEQDHVDRNLGNLMRELNDEEHKPMPGQGRIPGIASATLRASALPAIRSGAKVGLTDLQAFAKAVGEKGTARAIGNRIKAL